MNDIDDDLDVNDFEAAEEINLLRAEVASLKEQNAMLIQAADSVAVQEPVMYQRYSMGIGWVEVSFDDIEFYKGRGQQIRALYASPTLDKE